ncbi:hypothetical protein JHK82_033633 [Glycine max]|nr:hypothetical protein JHK85_034353 [Glycine max]KAG5119213.1 hypothetical protein JHK82_033633 [Glycine max]KAG5140208.1 hypothetical protein JHK84_033976 [Glycine max]
MDGRKKGVVTPIKDQGIIGSCWALSAVAAIEGIHQITTSKLMFLSKQKLVDSVKGESEGCIGGYVEDAFEFIVKKGGILSETHYPYKGVNIVRLRRKLIV